MIEQYKEQYIAVHSIGKGETYRASSTADVAPVEADTAEQAVNAIKAAIDNAG